MFDFWSHNKVILGICQFCLRLVFRQFQCLQSASIFIHSTLLQFKFTVEYNLLNLADASFCLTSDGESTEMICFPRVQSLVIQTQRVLPSLSSVHNQNVTEDLKCNLSFMSFGRFSSNAWPDTVKASVARKVDKSLSSG